MDRIAFISSDGHAVARMEDFRAYLDARFLEEFDDFLITYRERGSRNFDPPALRQRVNADDVTVWTTEFLETGRLEGGWDPHARVRELDREGIAAEVLFADFGLPFQLYSPGLAASLGHARRTQEQIDAGNRAYNRWLADFCQSAPERFAGMGLVSWKDVDVAVEEITWIKNAGLKGVVLPEFETELPLYHEQFSPIWQALEELELVVNSHTGLSSTSDQGISTPNVPHPSAAIRLNKPKFMFYCHEILSQLVWGGVLERHPRLQVVFTEQGSAWVVQELAEMDYTVQGSYYRQDIRDFLSLLPSEYFARQCYLGASIFSLSEVEARDRIGVEKMMIGADYPHFEGTIYPHGTKNYLRATFGAARVPLDEARVMLGTTAARVYGFDLGKLGSTVERIGLRSVEILTPPEEDLFPRGDVRRPIAV